MRRVLVTGADGFMGRNLVQRLLNQGTEVYAIVYPGNNVYANFDQKNLYVIEKDLAGALDIMKDFPRDIDVMYHFAWVGVNPEARDDLAVQMGNIRMTMDCMKLATEIGVKKVILPGSTNEYLYCGASINKDALPSPSNAYGAVKVALRYLCGNYAKNNDIEFIYAIITGVYAADRRDSNVIFYTIDKLLRGEKPSLTKLEQQWDYVYIDDVTEALFAIGERGKNGAVYAVGHGDNWALSNYIKIIHEKINPQIPLGIGEVPYANSVLPSSCVDMSDLCRDTGFVPKVDFEDGITRVIDAIKKDEKDEK